MSLKAQITEDMKTAMRAKDSARLSTIRLLQAAMKQKEVDERIELDDAAIIAIVDKLIKKCSRSTCASACRKPKAPPPSKPSWLSWVPPAPATWAR